MWNTRLEEGEKLDIERMWKGKSKRNVSSQRRKVSSLPPLHFFFFLWFFFSLCFSFSSSIWKEEDAKEKALETKGQKQEARSGSQKWEGKVGAWRKIPSFLYISFFLYGFFLICFFLFFSSVCLKRKRCQKKAFVTKG